MTIRSRHETIVFRNPFFIKSIARVLPAGTYEVVTDEELIEGLSFPSYRRIATAIMIPAVPPLPPSMEMIPIGSLELADAQRNDATAA